MEYLTTGLNIFTVICLIFTIHTMRKTERTYKRIEELRNQREIAAIKMQLNQEYGKYAERKPIE